MASNLKGMNHPWAKALGMNLPSGDISKFSPKKSAGMAGMVAGAAAFQGSTPQGWTNSIQSAQSQAEANPKNWMNAEYNSANPRPGYQHGDAGGPSGMDRFAGLKPPKPAYNQGCGKPGKGIRYKGG